tara:strand:+ start:502 stop:1767 length:1266 start_codon:yes stop_codon:yes gene_type:complete
MIDKIQFSKKRRFNYFKKKINFDSIFSPLLLLPFSLVIISSILIQSVQRQLERNDAFNHFFMGVLGYFIAIMISYIPLQKVKSFAIPFYILTLLSLISIYFFGISMYGAQRWLSIGFITFQPSEVAKLTTLLALATVFERSLFKSIKDLLFPFAVVIIPWTLIFFQPDLGTSLVLIFLFLTLLYWIQVPVEAILIVLFCLITSILSMISLQLIYLWIPLICVWAYKTFKGQKMYTLITLALHGLVAKITPFLWNIGLKDYQKDRLILFLEPGKDPLGGGYHLLQSKIAIGSGGLFGTGLLKGKLTNLQFIPEQHTDFIFSALGEEAGFFGSMLVVTIFFLLIFKLIKIAKKARTDFESLIVIGIASIFLFQIIINIYMTIGLGPVTGIPLPFMSYGRTSLLINFVFIGLALSAYKRCISVK